ncbi:MAG TPA: hypothetical protein ACFYD3_09210, partial [Candidatus Hypogeohydataceae bacterium YC41]
GLPAQAQAVLKDLTLQQLQEAIEYGKKGKDTTMADFAKEWTVNLGEKVGWATLYTRFQSLAYRARKAAVENRELTDKEIKTALETGETLTFSITILCDDLYFTRLRPATLRQGETAVTPSFEFIPKLAETSNFYPESPAYMASCVYKFPIKTLNTDASVTLVVVTPEGEERLFLFDLSRMR